MTNVTAFYNIYVNSFVFVQSITSIFEYCNNIVCIQVVIFLFFSKAIIFIATFKVIKSMFDVQRKKNFYLASYLHFHSFIILPTPLRGLLLKEICITKVKRVYYFIVLPWAQIKFTMINLNFTRDKKCPYDAISRSLFSTIFKSAISINVEH